MKRWMLAGFTLLAFAPFAGCDDSSGNGSAATVTVTQAQNGGTVALAVGETLVVQLAGNPTTGYEWTIATIDAAFLQALGSTYAADSDALGAGGTYTFRFRAMQAGTTTLALAYRRAWEPAAIETFTLAVNIQDAGTDTDSEANTLEGTRWKLAAWSASSLDPARFDITANFAGGQISGHSAVNSYSGDYAATAEGVFSTGALAATLMAGEPDAMQAESLYLALLQQARRWRSTGGQLILSGGTQDLLIFNPQ